MGGVYRVKPLGVYAMIDDGELDWKVSGLHPCWGPQLSCGSRCSSDWSLLGAVAGAPALHLKRL
jgi:hypothetical protein